MASLLIRNLDETVKAALRRRAAANGRSMEEEARVILASETRKSRGRRQGLGSRLLRIGELARGYELVVAPRTEMPRESPFTPDE